MSKEERRLHVVFTTSDSFFSRCILDPGKHIYSMRRRSFLPCGTVAKVISLLPTAKAYEYFLSLVQSLHVACQDLFGKGIEPFEKVYHMTGGRMIFIELYVSAVKKALTLSHTGQWKDMDSNLLISTKFKLEKSTV